MRGILRPVLDAYGVGFRVLHGYSSATVMKDIANATTTADAPLRAYYVGDWDPSGMFMSQIDIPKRLAEYGARVEFSRLALIEDDLHRFDMIRASFPAIDKRKDPRFRWFVENVGSNCWEVDALSPVVIRDRVEDAIVSMITDVDAWERFQMAERAELESLQEVLGEWARTKAA